MSIDDLITALLVLLFVGVPIVRGVLRSRNRSGGQGAAPPARPERNEPGAEPQRGAPPPAAGRPAEAAPRRSDAGGGDDEIQRMLEQARRRVAEALGEPAAGSGSTDGSLSGGQAADRGLAGGAPATAAGAGGPAPGSGPSPISGPFLGREGRAPSGAAGSGGSAAPNRPGPISGPFLGREGRPGDEGRPPATTARPIGERSLLDRARLQPHGRKVTRAQPASPDSAATLRYGFRVDRESIVQGFLWHQILSKPVSKRRSRRPARPPRTHLD